MKKLFSIIAMQFLISVSPGIGASGKDSGFKSKINPADSVIFMDDFSGTAIGSFPKALKTNGTASIVTFSGEKGKWLALKDKAIYKLSRAITYPKQFTLEFDIIASADQLKDISPVYFGFSKDNSIAEYSTNNGVYVELHYYDTDQVNVCSAGKNQFLNSSFDLSASLNRPMHVTLNVTGKVMAVYLNETRIAESALFTDDGARNFYICGPWEYANNSRILISNLKVTKH